MTDIEEQLAAALARTLEAARKDPDLMRIWLAAYAIHLNYGHPPIEDMRAYTGDLTAKELRRARRQLNREDITDMGKKN